MTRKPFHPDCACQDAREQEAVMRYINALKLGRKEHEARKEAWPHG